jgi:hypothetical protein
LVNRPFPGGCCSGHPIIYERTRHHDAFFMIFPSSFMPSCFFSFLLFSSLMNSVSF